MLPYKSVSWINFDAATALIAHGRQHLFRLPRLAMECSRVKLLGDLSGGVAPVAYIVKQGINDCGGIARPDLDWESGNLYANWITISPLLKHWIREEAKLIDWQHEIVCGLMDYEAHRLHFLSGASIQIRGILASGENWVAFRPSVQLNQTLQKLRSGSELTSEALREGLVVLARYASRKFAAPARTHLFSLNSSAPMTVEL